MTLSNITDSATTEKLPIVGLLALAMTSFIGIMTETMPAGLLPLIAEELNVTQSLAGQMVTVYAIGSLLAAIPLTIATQGWGRRKVLLLTIIGFLIFNTVTAISENYWLTLIARFFAGVAAGLAWSLLANYARRMVEIPQQGKAMAIALIGTPIALALGLPIGTWLGNLVGWRFMFGIMSVLTFIQIFWILAKVPDFPGQILEKRTTLNEVIKIDGVKPILLVVVIWMLAHNILYTYIAPFIAIANLSNYIDFVLLVFGLMALVGIWGTGKLIDSYMRSTVLLSLLIFSFIAIAFIFWNKSPHVILIGVGIWGLTFGGAGTLVQTALADAAGDGADVALSINVVGWNGAIAGGGIFGGLLLDKWGPSSLPIVVTILLFIGIYVVWMSKASGFPLGPRLLNHLNRNN